MRSNAWLLSISAALLACFPLFGEEPPQATSPPIEFSFPALGEYDDRDNQHFSFHFGLVDVGDSLVAANGLGIDVAAPDAALRAQLGLDEGQGLVVTKAPEESIGAKAGLKLHDILAQVNGEEVDAAYFNEILASSDGKRIKLRILRGGKPIEVEATPKKPEEVKIRWAQEHVQKYDSAQLVAKDAYRIGVTLAEADDTLRAHLRLAAGEGLVVTDVFDDTAAAAAGIRQHDVLVVLDGKRLTTVETINAQIQEIKEKQIELRLLRGGKEVTLQIAPRKVQEAAFRNEVITLWDTKSCQRCHANPHGDAHANLARWLGADKSVWTDGNRVELYGSWLKTAPSQPDALAPAPQQQIQALRAQLAEMQSTLTALEAALAPSAADTKDKE